jgi:hypothetical protein
MRCLGRTTGLVRCSRDSRLGFCPQHQYQLLLATFIVLGVTVFLAAFRSDISLLWASQAEPPGDRKSPISHHAAIDHNRLDAFLDSMARTSKQRYESESVTLLVAAASSAQTVGFGSSERTSLQEFYKMEVEPGSLVIPFVVSTALDLGIITDSTSVFAEQGRYLVGNKGEGGRAIVDDHPAGYLTPPEILSLSSSIGAVKIGEMLGPQSICKSFVTLGLLDADDCSRLSNSQNTLKAVCFGYELLVTYDKIVRAYSYLCPPEQDGGNPTGAPITSRTAVKVREWLALAVESGTGKPAGLEHVGVSGKTATTRIFSKGRYERSRYMAAMVTIFPTRNPRYLCLAIVNDPRTGASGGGPVCGPILKAVNKYIHEQEAE